MKFNDKDFLFEPMNAQYSDEVISLIAASMNEDEGRWAEKTIKYHFFCEKNNVADGRKYYILKNKAGEVCGITGLHSYIWGPEDVAWLGWFAVSPKMQGLGLGYYLIKQTIEMAKENGLRKIFVETYSNEDFATARKAYERYGFSIESEIKDYTKPGISMVVFSMDL